MPLARDAAHISAVQNLQIGHAELQHSGRSNQAGWHMVFVMIGSPLAVEALHPHCATRSSPSNAIKPIR
jgi:hypothetical protein